MRKDTQSFLVTLLGVPTLLLTGVLFHNGIFPETISAPELSVTETPEEPLEILADNKSVVETQPKTSAPVPAKIPVAVVTPVPVVTPTPTPTPVPTPAPKPVVTVVTTPTKNTTTKVSRPSRTTRAS